MFQSLKFISRFNFAFPSMSSLHGVSNNIVNPPQPPIVTTSSLLNILNIALCQIKVSNDKQYNIQHMKEMIHQLSTSSTTIATDLIVSLIFYFLILFFLSIIIKVI